MFKLAHLSDIHLAPFPEPSVAELVSKRVTGYLNWKKNRAHRLDPSILEGLVAHLKEARPDHVAVTGDLVNLALAGEFAPARDWLHRLGGAADVSLVPGNHDIYVPGSMEMALSHWGAFMKGDDGSQAIAFPFLRRRADMSIIGANSAVVTPPFFATGDFDLHQAQGLERMLVEEGALGRFRVVMIHHPPFPGAASFHKRLVNAARFRAVIARAGAELVLHGHTHLATRQMIAGPDGQVPVICVPSASQAPGGKRPAARHNIFSIEGGPGEWQCRMEEFGYAQSGSGVQQIASRTIIENGRLVMEAEPAV